MLLYCYCLPWFIIFPLLVDFSGFGVIARRAMSNILRGFSESTKFLSINTGLLDKRLLGYLTISRVNDFVGELASAFSILVNLCNIGFLLNRFHGFLTLGRISAFAGLCIFLTVVNCSVSILCFNVHSVSCTLARYCFVKCFG